MGFIRKPFLGDSHFCIGDCHHTTLANSPGISRGYCEGFPAILPGDLFPNEKWSWITHCKGGKIILE